MPNRNHSLIPRSPFGGDKLSRRVQRRREQLGLTAVSDHMRCLGGNFAVVGLAAQKAREEYNRGAAEGYNKAVAEAEVQ